MTHLDTLIANSIRSIAVQRTRRVRNNPIIVRRLEENLTMLKAKNVSEHARAALTPTERKTADINQIKKLMLIQISVAPSKSRSRTAIKIRSQSLAKIQRNIELLSRGFTTAEIAIFRREVSMEKQQKEAEERAEEAARIAAKEAARIAMLPPRQILPTTAFQMELTRLQTAITNAQNKGLAGFRGGGGSLSVRNARKSRAKQAGINQAKAELTRFLEAKKPGVIIIPKPQPIIMMEPQQIIPVKPLPLVISQPQPFPMEKQKSDLPKIAVIGLIGAVLLG